jgi:hypothetical protein
MKNVILILLGVFVICACACMVLVGIPTVLVLTAGPTYNVPVSRMEASYLTGLSTVPGYVEIDPGDNSFISDPRISSKLFTKSSLATGTGEIEQYILVQTGDAILDATEVVARLDNASCSPKVSTNIANGNIIEFKGNCAGRAYYFLERVADKKVILFETAEMGQLELEAFIKAYAGI